MSVLEQTTSTSKSPRRIPSTVRLGTEVMNELCTQLGVGEVRADNSQCVAGLLFGIAEHDVLSVKALKNFPARSSVENGSPEYVETAFERYLATAQTDPEIASLHLVGWYGMRRPGEIATLSDSDVEFHNRRFRRATDIAIILKPKQHAGASMDSIELYGRSF